MHPLRLPFERRADDRGLARAGLADQQRDALLTRDRVLEVAERLAMRVGQHEIPRVRRQVERPLTEPEERLVHQRTQPAMSSISQTITAMAPVMATSDAEMAMRRSVLGAAHARAAWSSPE